MTSARSRVFDRVRLFSASAVATVIALSLVLNQLIENSALTWQVGVALLALAIGIPHGALDHLAVLPRSSPLRLATFISIYVAIALASIWAILTWNVYGFFVVVVMSAVHFGIGDAAFIAERDHALGQERAPRLAQVFYAFAAGVVPVVIPLVSERSSAALSAINSDLVDWDGGYAGIFYTVAIGLSISAIAIQLIFRRNRDALDLVLLLALSLIAPPLVAFAVYFGMWHAMRHTARLTLNLKKCARAYEENNSKKAFTAAIIPGLPALFGTLIFAGGLVLFTQGDLADNFLWVLLVVTWALTVPHMMATAKLDRSAFQIGRSA